MPVAQTEKKYESATAAFFFEQAEKFAEAKAWSSARFWYEQAAAQGNAKAQFNLGLMYAKGRGGPQDFAEACRWYEKAAHEYVPAQTSL